MVTSQTHRRLADILAAASRSGTQVGLAFVSDLNGSLTRGALPPSATPCPVATSGSRRATRRPPPR